MQAPQQPAGFLRRLAAIFYDGMLLFGTLFIISVPIVIAVDKGTGVPLYDHPVYFAYIALMYLIAYVYFAWFWTRNSQTLGMRAWRIRIITRDGGRITWFQAAMRFIGAIISWLPLGAGFIWSLTNRNKTSWHDLLSGSILVLAPKEKLLTRTSHNKTN